MFCKQCGAEISERFCSRCGCDSQNQVSQQMQINTAKTKSEEKHTGRDILTGVLLLIVYTAPIGIILMWVFEIPRSKGFRIFASVLFAILFLFAITPLNSNDNAMAKIEEQQPVIEIQTNDNTETATTDTKEVQQEQEENTEYPFDMFVDGMYKVGTDIAAGEYVAEALGYERGVKAVQDHVEADDLDEIPIRDSIGRMQQVFNMIF